MQRDDLFTPGTYASLPSAVLRRLDLSATAKLVYMAIANELRGDATEVSVSIALLAGRIGAGRTAVKEAIAALKSAGLLAAIAEPGRRTRYRFQSPGPGRNPTGLELQTGSESDRVDNGTGSESDHPPGRIPCKTGSDSDHHVPPTPDTPPIPPEGGECERGELVTRIRTAYEAAFGESLPGRWPRAIRRAAREGDRAALARIDAATLRRASAWRVAAGLSGFGVGTVLAYLEARVSADRIVHPASFAAAPSPAARIEAAREAADADLLARFRERPEPERLDFIARARNGHNHNIPAAALEILAARLAADRAPRTAEDRA